MDAGLMIDQLFTVMPLVFKVLISIVGFLFVIAGVLSIASTDNLFGIVEYNSGVIGIIIGLVLMYYGDAFIAIWSLIKWVS